MPIYDCKTHCRTAQTAFGMVEHGGSEERPCLAYVKDYLAAISDAGVFRVDVEQAAIEPYSFLCTFRPGTKLYHFSPQDFTGIYDTKIHRGSFYTTSFEYANFLGWTELSVPGNLSDPTRAVILEYAPPKDRFLFVNSRVYTGTLLTDAKAHGVEDAKSYPDNEFSQKRNYAVHAKIFCNSLTNYGVNDLAGVIQGTHVTKSKLASMLDRLLAQGLRDPGCWKQREANFNILCKAIRGVRADTLRKEWACAFPKEALGDLDQRCLAQHEELYWNVHYILPRKKHCFFTPDMIRLQRINYRRNMANLSLLRPSTKSAKMTRLAINRLEAYQGALVALCRENHSGCQYCFDYRTYGPIITTEKMLGIPHPSTAKACLTALKLPLEELRTVADSLIAALGRMCESSDYSGPFTHFKLLIQESSNRCLSVEDIKTLRSLAAKLREYITKAVKS